MPRRHSRFVRIFGTIVFAIVTVLFAVLIVNAFMNGGKPLTTLVPQGPVRPGHPEPHHPGVRHRRRRVRRRHGRHARHHLEVPGEGQRRPRRVPRAGPRPHGPRDRLDHPPGAHPRRRRRRHRDHHPRAQQDEPEDAIKVEVIGQQWWWEYQVRHQRRRQLRRPRGHHHRHRAGHPRRSRDRPHHHLQRRHPLVLDPRPQRQEGRRARASTSPLEASQADEPGIYRGQCTEFCGLSHANMRMLVRAAAARRVRRAGSTNQLRTTPRSPTGADAARRAARSASRCAPSAT